MTAWTEPMYAVRSTSPDEYEVTKFLDRKEPEAVYRVGLHSSGWWTDSPAFGRLGEQEKHIRLVRAWIRSGSPVGTFWKIDGEELERCLTLDH